LNPITNWRFRDTKTDTGIQESVDESQESVYSGNADSTPEEPRSAIPSGKKWRLELSFEEELKQVLVQSFNEILIPHETYPPDCSHCIWHHWRSFVYIMEKMAARMKMTMTALYMSLGAPENLNFPRWMQQKLLEDEDG